jgi:ribosomal protein L22
MTTTTYAYPLDQHTASAYGRGLAISTKSSINICNKLRNMPVAKAISYLERVIAKKDPVPFTRFDNAEEV